MTEDAAAARHPARTAKYAAMLGVALRQGLSERGALLGRVAFGLDPAFAAEVAGRLVIWGAVSALLLGWFYRRGLRVLDVNGG